MFRTVYFLGDLFSCYSSWLKSCPTAYLPITQGIGCDLPRSDLRFGDAGFGVWAFGVGCHPFKIQGFGLYESFSKLGSLVGSFL